MPNILKRRSGDLSSKVSLISDKITPWTNEGKDHPFGYSRRMKYMMNTKEPARLTVIKGAIDGVYTVDLASAAEGYSP